MKRKQQVCQTESEENQFEISTTTDDTTLKINEDENNRSTCAIFLLLFGLLIFIVSIVDSFIAFYFPYKKIKENKRKCKEAKFEKLPIFEIVIHFILHALVCLYGFLIILSFCMNSSEMMTCAQLLVFLITFVWFIEASNCPIHDYKPDLYIDDLFKIINNNPPIDSINVHYETIFNSWVSTNNFYQNIFRNNSNKDVKIPVYTSMASKLFKYDDFPDIFYTTVNQNINLSTQFVSYFQNILNIKPNINFVSKTYLVSKQKHLNYLSKKTRILSHVFGVGLYYVLYTKSIPKMVTKTIINAEMISNFNYSKTL